MLFDSTLMFYHAGTAWGFTAGEYVSLVGTQTASASTSVINLGNARDLGIGDGQEIPNVFASFGQALTSSCSSLTVNLQFQGSTNSVLWTTYMETGAASTASYAAGGGVNFRVPRRPPGVALPLYYQLNVAITGAGTANVTLSTGTILAGIILAPASSGGTLDQYASGFTVA